MLVTAVKRALSLLRRYFHIGLYTLGIGLSVMLLSFSAIKIYQHWDNDTDRGAIGLRKGAFNESYSTPIYLDQGWGEADSLWFYNTTQGSGLIPYDFFIALEQPRSRTLFRSKRNLDRFRYLTQKATFFNPDALPVGMVRDTYKGKSYLGFTCAACHTSQLNFKAEGNKTHAAIRIDGGPSMIDLVGFLNALEQALRSTLQDGNKRTRFANRVIAQQGDYQQIRHVVKDLRKWTQKIALYNLINYSDTPYGYARTDAFGRIYNRVLVHVINKKQLGVILSRVTQDNGKRLLSDRQVELVLRGISETIIGDDGFVQIMQRLRSRQAGYPALNFDQLLLIRDAVFNEPNAPVSYPYLWDVAQSDYLQWNGLAANDANASLVRNTSEAIGSFSLLEWQTHHRRVSFASRARGQAANKNKIKFTSSINLHNLQRLESHLKSLRSPKWPENILGKIDWQKVKQGRMIYRQYCQSCHEVIEHDNWNRKVISKMIRQDLVATDSAMVNNSVNYTGKSGNFEHIYQQINGVGNKIIEEDAPVVQLLNAATWGVTHSRDPDKLFVQRWLEKLYAYGITLFDHQVQPSVKAGNYRPDSSTQPYASLMAYKARPLNGIWASAPYLHNGSVPSLYDLLLPKRRTGDPEDGEYRPDVFTVGSREFDILKIGFKTQGYKGFQLQTQQVGNLNSGHEFAAGRTPQLDGRILPALNRPQRLALLEYLKTL